MSSANTEYPGIRGDISVPELPTTETTILSLPETPLLKIFGYLNLTDAINFAMTCVTMHEFSDLVLRKRNFDLVDGNAQQDKETQQQGRLFIKYNLYNIGHTIRVLRIYIEEIDNAVMEKCRNIKCLRIESSTFWEENENTNVIEADQLSTWIKKLKLKSLRFGYGIGKQTVLKLSEGVTNLKELEIGDEIKNAKALFEGKLSVDNLHINVENSFDFNIFQQLQQLQCLHIRMAGANFDQIIEFVKLNGVIEFALYSYSHETGKLNYFLQSLAEKSNVEKLRLYLPHTLPDENTFRVLKLFNLTSLDLYFRSSFGDCPKWKMHLQYPARRSIELNFKSQRQEVMKDWVS